MTAQQSKVPKRLNPNGDLMTAKLKTMLRIYAKKKVLSYFYKV